MKIINKSIFLIFTIFLLISFAGFSQNTEHLDSLDNVIYTAARDIMSSAGTCALITLDHEGRPRARAMDPFLPENDFTVWFGTNTNSRKVDQIKKDPRVTLYYLGSNSSGYVMIHGIAQIIDNQEEKDKRWKDEWEAFYPNKLRDYLLIKVSPEWMEVISYSHGLVGDTITWKPPAIIFDSK
jgi:general stress protein 26